MYKYHASDVMSNHEKQKVPWYDFFCLKRVCNDSIKTARKKQTYTTCYK